MQQSCEQPCFASILLDVGVDKPLDYRVPDSLQNLCKPGIRVQVPVRGRPQRGTILALKASSEVASVQNILELLSERTAVSSELFQLAEWMAKYYSTPLRRVLKVMMPAPLRKNSQQKKQLFITSNLSRPELAKACEEIRRKSPVQAEVLDALLLHPKGLFLSELLEKAKTTNSPIKTLIKKKLLHAEPIFYERSPIDDQEVVPTKPKILREEQEISLSKITHSLEKNSFHAHLIYGVTGSGKTEIYLQAIDFALKQGKGVILLVPEIMLTSQTLERIQSRFSEKVALLHHRLSDGERHATWQKIQDGALRIVMGARSAVFSPVKNLGLIIIDEEHESSYKQNEEQPTYHARDIALMRGKLENATVVLGSATPSLESYHNALEKRFELSTLVKKNSSPVHIVDMKAEFAKAKGFTLFSERLIDALKKRKSLGEQTILLLNRRGYHTSCLCTSCGEVAKCPNCSLSLTYHQSEEILSCHQCDFRSPPLHACPKCKAEKTMKYKGAGTELVERSLHALLPDLRTLRLDADTTRHKGSHELIFQKFRSGKADVLIGTQMVAKGLHFPAVTLVGVLNADGALNIPDFRASEKSFQLLTQVAGRAGRGELEGEVIIQTHLPTHSTIGHAKNQDYISFFNEEIEARKLFGYPPFCHLARLVFSGTKEESTKEFAQLFRKELISHLPPSFQIMPVVPCGYPKIQERFRFQFLIKGTRSFLLSQKLQLVQQKLPLRGDMRLLIDIDPETTFF
jgi:primosomal protein N' (replication factor Y)